LRHVTVGDKIAIANAKSEPACPNEILKLSSLLRSGLDDLKR
jgi:hypothetical protein